MIEVIKTIGSFVGLLTAVVYFYDRFAKGRPAAILDNFAGSAPSVTAHTN
jgi:hypothetical protein